MAISQDLDPDQALCLLEHSLGVHITIHDLTGVFQRQGQQVLTLKRRCHQHQLCKLPGPSRHGCMDHCYNAVHRELLRQGGPGCHHCWRGACEITVPLFINGSHVASIFAGPWRSGELPPPKLPKRHHHLWHELPPFPQAEATRIAGLLGMLGHGLLRSCESQITKGDEPRRHLIDEWLQAHCRRQWACSHSSIR